MENDSAKIFFSLHKQENGYGTFFGTEEVYKLAIAIFITEGNLDIKTHMPLCICFLNISLHLKLY